MEIFYSPYSTKGEGIADRRRLLFWASERKHQVIIIDNDSKIPNNAQIIITSSSDLVHWANFKRVNPNSRIYLDIVDGIHGEISSLKDFLRGISLVFSGRVSGFPTSMQKILSCTVPFFDGIVCSSPEQSKLWRKYYSGNVAEILDFHEEIPELSGEIIRKSDSGASLFWEGLPYTLSHFSILRDFFYHLQPLDPMLNVYTSFNSKRYLGRFGNIEPRKILRDSIGSKGIRFEIHQWSIESLATGASKAAVGVIPMQSDKGYDALKAENRLLIMWRLGLPTLTSPLDSYLRVEQSLGLPLVCKTTEDWLNGYHKLITDYDYRQLYINRTRNYLKNYHSRNELLLKWDSVFNAQSR